ncbi:RcpC/CpaB family pilus assembly protein [Clostridium sp. HBUAS56017]|uniref:RcpC/CpaB family pilus assembly protein n=1 Tax=Clostridium sp. HBUAS56017 TaxID=2571128 RepID=UPI0011784342|nr:RcpC/CpaB family pilus assembly protein [Clostridium sp. HBUAS56017]
MKNKITAFVISLVITVVSFLFILYIEQKIFNPEGTTSVYVVNKDKLDKGYVITEDNFDQLFKLEKRRSDQVTPYYIKNKEDLYNFYIKQDMYKNEIIAADKVESLDNDLKNIDEKREITVTAPSSAAAVGGKLREGDKVDLIATNKKSNSTITETKIKNLYISKVYGSDGNLISKDDKTKLALTITFTLSRKDAEEVQNSVSLGSWSLIKVLEE